ncbi:hypothetical protein AEQU2_02045 [Aequorivita lipolytica]|nr:hypothetical protein AEQU2_02045 [Aequorivita lipolytica]
MKLETRSLMLEAGSWKLDLKNRAQIDNKIIFVYSW